MKGYKTSKDYKRLKKLLDEGYKVVCFITYDFDQFNHEPHEPMMVTDVCLARLLYPDSKQSAKYSLAVRGTEFLTYWLHGISHKYTFEELLKARNVEFIEPNEEG